MPGKPEDLTPPSAGEAVLPLPREISPGRWALRGLIWAALLALLGLLIFWLDVPRRRPIRKALLARLGLDALHQLISF